MLPAHFQEVTDTIYITICEIKFDKKGAPLYLHTFTISTTNSHEYLSVLFVHHDSSGWNVIVVEAEDVSK